MSRDTFDPDDTLAEFRATRHTIAAAITAYNRDEHRIERASEAADHHDELEELYRDTSDLMAAIDDHLTTGGALPAAWTPTTPAPRTATETGTATHESRQPDMTDHREHRNHDMHDYDLDPANLDTVAVSELRDARDQAASVGDLVCALRADNALEDRSALGPTGRRRTCRDWADHLHDQLTGEIMRAGRWAADVTGEDLVTAATIAAQVFALASVAAPGQWQELSEGEYRITVEVNTTAYDVIVPGDEPGWDGQPRPPYIDSFRPGPAGCLILPVIHATTRATAALIEARRYLTAPSHR